MVAQQQFQVDLPGRPELGGIGLDVHALGNRQDAGRAERAGAGIHDTHAAGADLVDILQVAQRGDVDPSLFGGFENRRAGGDFNTDAVNRKLNEIFHLCCSSSRDYSLMIAPNLHVAMQFPHLMHFC